MPSLCVLVHSGPVWVAERVQREIRPEIDTLYASNGHNLPLLRASTLNPKLFTLNPKPPNRPGTTLNRQPLLPKNDCPR